MGEITIDTAVLLSICALICAIGGAVVWIKRALSPILRPMKDLQAEVKDLKDKSLKDYERLNEHEKLLRRIEEDNKELLKSVRLLLRHFESGNSLEEIRGVRKELDEYIINR